MDRFYFFHEQITERIEPKENGDHFHENDVIAMSCTDMKARAVKSAGPFQMKPGFLHSRKQH